MSRRSARRSPAQSPAQSPASSPVAPSAPAAAPWWHPVTAGRAALAYLALALLHLAPALVPGRQLGGTDYTAAGSMVLGFVNRAMASGRLPGWIPDIMGGVPIFANPGSTFHPVRLLLAAVFPHDLVLALLFATYFVVAGVGMFLLMRELGVRPWVAFIAGLAYELTGTLASLLYAGHDGRFIVAASGPLFLFCLHRGVRTGAVAPFAGAAATIGLALLSFQLQSSYYLLLAGAAWSLFAIVAHGIHRRPAALARRVGLGLAAVALGFAMGAVNFLPFTRYVEASPRATSVARGAEFATSFSMPLAETIGLAVPEQAGILAHYRGPNPFKYHTEYAGALVVALLALGLLVARRDRRWWFFAGLAVVGLTIAWGGNTPLYRVYLALLPGTDRFRAPSIAMLLVAIAIVAMAGLALERLAALRDEQRDERTARARGAAAGDATVRAVGRLLAAMVGAAIVFALTLGVSGPASAGAAAGWLRFGLVLAVVGGALVLWLRGTVATRAAAVVLAVVTAADLWTVDRHFLLVMDASPRLYAADDVVLYLKGQPDLEHARVWVFPNAAQGDHAYRGNGTFGVHTNYMMHHGIAQVGGEHGNQLQRWNEYVGTGTRPDGEGGMIDWHNLIETMPMTAALGVRYVVSRIDLSRYRARDSTIHESGMRLVYEGSAGVFRNERALPRAFLAAGAEVVPDGAAAIARMKRDDWDPRRTAVVERPLGEPLPGGEPHGTARFVADRPDSVVVRTTADRPALLVLADNFYPDWVAYVDGARAPIHRVNHTLRGVVVGAGEHEVRFEFRSPELVRGLWFSLAAALLLAGYGVAAAVGARRAR